MSYNSSDEIDNEDAQLDDNLIVNEKIESNSEARKKIEDLLEKKRLKELLDDSTDW